MIPILTQNIKLMILHQSSKDLIRAEDIGKCFAQYFQNKPNLIIGLQENFWKKGYSTIQRNLPAYVYCSKILNENSSKCISENGGVSFLFNKDIYNINIFDFSGINNLSGLTYRGNDDDGVKHFMYCHSEGEEYLAAKGLLLGKILELKTNKEFFILNTHAQATRPGYKDRIQTTLAQMATVGELICLLKKEYPTVPVIFMGDFNVPRSFEQDKQVHFNLLEQCLPLVHAYKADYYTTYSVLEDGPEMMSGLIDIGLQEQENAHLDHVFSNREIINIVDKKLMNKDQIILSDHRGLYAEVNLDSLSLPPCYEGHYSKELREQLIHIGKLRSGLNLVSCCSRRAVANNLFQELCASEPPLFLLYNLHKSRRSSQIEANYLSHEPIEFENVSQEKLCFP